MNPNHHLDDATLMAFGRFTSDFEITAMKASGVNMIRVLIPLLAVASLLTYLMIEFNDRLLPDLNRQARSLRADISVEDVMCLKPDDVIVIDRKISEPLEMPVGTGSVILGNIGIFNNRLALKITDIRKRYNDAEEVIPSHG